MGEKYWGIYGSVRMLRVYCSRCKGMTLVKDGIKLCCDDPAVEKSMQSKVMSGGTERKKPCLALRQKILKLQDNKCLYCGKTFGTPYTRNGSKVLFTKLCFDHLIPYSYSQINKNNFVAACHICNGIKSNLMFNTVEEVYHYVEYTRKKKGVIFCEDLSGVQKAV